MFFQTISRAVLAIVLFTGILPSGNTDDLPVPSPNINSDGVKQVAIPKRRATGKVIAPDGTPLGKVPVWVVTSYGVIRRYHETFQTETDANGEFRVEGLPGVQEYGRIDARAYAISSTRPWVSIPFRTTTDENVVPDLVLPERGSSLTVRAVDEGGKPIAGANVGPAVEDDGAPVMFYLEQHSLENANALQQVLRPFSKTGEDGVAHFSNLPFGNYVVRGIWVPKITGSPKTSKLITIEGEYYSNGGEKDTKSGYCKYLLLPKTDKAECTVRMHKVF